MTLVSPKTDVLLMVTRLLLSLAALCLWASSAGTQAEVTFNADSTAVSLNGEMQFLPDDDKRLALADAIRAQQEGRMQRLHGPLNRGYAPVASWLHVVVRNDGATPATPYLLMSPPFLDEVDVYLSNGADPDLPATYRRYAVGDHTPVAEQPVPTALMAVPLSIAPGASLRVFIRVHSFSAHILFASLVSPREFQRRISSHVFWHSAYVALGVSLATINLLLSLRLRSQVNARYALYLLGLASAVFGIQGLARVLLPEQAHHLNDWIVGGGVGLSYSAAMLFVMRLFDTALQYPWVYRYQQLVCAMGVVVFLASGTQWYAPLAALLQLNGPVVAILHPWLAWRSIQRGEIATGRLFLQAFSANSLGVIVTALGVLGITPLNAFTANAIEITSVVHMVVMMLGLSERVLVAEAELRAAASEAKDRAEAIALRMNEELIASKKELERSLDCERRVRDEQARFIDTISHEYRTPLSIVRTNLDIVHTKRQIDERRFGAMTSALSRLDAIFSDALSAHRLGRPPPPKFVTIDLKALLEEALTETRHAAPDCEFDYESEPGRLPLFGDAGLISTVLRNVLANAAKYRSGNPVAVTLRREGGRAVLVVDNAVDPGTILDHARLFERWERGPSVSGQGGMGLGLYLVRRILHDHAGEVAVACEPADRFIITLTIPLLSSDQNG